MHGMHRFLLFKLGFVPLVFLFWSWWESNRSYSYASCEAAGRSLTANHSCSRIYIEFYSGAAVGWPRNFDIFREANFDGKSPFRIGNRFFPSPEFVHEVPDLPFDRLSEDERFRADRGETSGSITIPHWLILLAYVAVWLGLARFVTSKRKAASAAVIDSRC